MLACAHTYSEFWRYTPVVPVAQHAEAKKSLEPRKEPNETTSQKYVTDLQIHAHIYFLCKKAIWK